MKKRMMLMLCVTAIVFSLTACSNKKSETEETMSQPVTEQSATEAATEAATEPVTEAVTEPPEPEYKTYQYEAGALTVTMPYRFEGEPVKEENSLVVSDPGGLWTIKMTPLTFRKLETERANISDTIEGQKKIGFYIDVVREERTYGEFQELYCSFDINTGWDFGKQGYPFGEREPHAYHLIDYGDLMIGEWGGLKIEVIAADAGAVMEELMSDKTVSTIVDMLEFEEGTVTNVMSIGGLSAEFPAKWRSNGRETSGIWSVIQGDTEGSIYFTVISDTDAEERGSYVSADYKTTEWGGHTWYGDAAETELSGEKWYSLQMFTPYDEEHSVNLTLYLNDAESIEDVWAYTERQEFKDILNTLKFDPASYVAPVDKSTDESGFQLGGHNEISGYTGEGGEIVIPTEINGTKIYGISSAAFAGNTKITSVVVPEGINRIMTDAFKDCTSLKSVVLPNSLNYIDYSGFYGCTALETVDLGSGIRTIGTCGFAGCTSLESIELGDNLVNLGQAAFADCTALKDVILPSTITEIGMEAFRNAGSGEGIFESYADGAVYGNNCFRDARFKEITFGPSSDLSEMSILEGTHVEKVTIQEGTTALGERFMYAGFMMENEISGDNDPLEVVLPASLKSIGASAFVKRYGLTNINLPQGLETLGSRCFSECGLTQITVPGTVKEIPEYCFDECVDLGAITLEEGVEVIGKSAFGSAGYRESDEEHRYYVYLTDEEAEKEASQIVEGGTLFVRIYTPSTLKRIDDYAFQYVWVGGLFMEWCTSPDMLPEYSENAWNGIKRMARVYFTKETMETYGEQLTAHFKERIEKMDKVEYDFGSRCYWLKADRPDSVE